LIIKLLFNLRSFHILDANETSIKNYIDIILSEGDTLRTDSTSNLFVHVNDYQLATSNCTTQSIDLLEESGCLFSEGLSGYVVFTPVIPIVRPEILQIKLNYQSQNPLFYKVMEKPTIFSHSIYE